MPRYKLTVQHTCWNINIQQTDIIQTVDGTIKQSQRREKCLIEEKTRKTFVLNFSLTKKTAFCTCHTQRKMIQVFLSRWTPLSSSFPSSFVKLKTSKSGNRMKTNKRALSFKWMNRLCYRITSGYWKSRKRAGRRLWSSVETWAWSPSRSPPKMFLTRFWPVSCLCGSFLNRELVLQVRLKNYRKKQSD